MSVAMTQTRSLVALLSPLVSIALFAASAVGDNLAELSPTMNDYAPSSKAGSIQAAVNTMYNLEVRKIATKSEPIPTQKVEIESNNIPLLIHFKSQSSKLKVIQSHKSGVGETQKSMSEDEPDILIHEVKKPIFQQVKEIIVPYRKTVQEIRPVQEQMETIVARSHPMNSQNHHKEEIPVEGERPMGAGGRPPPYMKEVDRYIGNEEEGGDRSGPQEANLVNLDFEPDMSKAKFLPLSGGALLSGPHLAHLPPPPHHQYPLGVPLPLPKLNKPMRRQLLAPISGLQRRMLFTPSRAPHQAEQQKPQKHKRKWKLFYLH